MRKTFLTSCELPSGKVVTGPEIYAETREQAEHQLLQIRGWLNQITQRDLKFQVLGEVVQVICLSELPPGPISSDADPVVLWDPVDGAITDSQLTQIVEQVRRELGGGDD